MNWRLPGLLEGLKRKDVPTFKTMAHYSPNEFYADDTGVHYAEARYLCYWLQEKGLLSKYVRRAQALKDEDGTGWKALNEVLGADPDTLRPEWEKFVLGLSSGA